MDAVAVLNFKVYLLGKSNAQEVRRFAIPKDINLDFVYLHRKLHEVFPELQHKSFAIYWRDFENDDIRIGSDEELRIALTTLVEPVKKLYIKLWPTNNYSKSDIPDHTHTGISCNSCNARIKGFRYKCLQCPSYDLCETCETRHCHPQHMLLRLPEDIPITYDKFWRKISILSAFIEKFVAIRQIQNSDRTHGVERSINLERAQAIERTLNLERSQTTERTPHLERSPQSERGKMPENNQVQERGSTSRPDNFCLVKLKRAKTKQAKNENAEGRASEETTPPRSDEDEGSREEEKPKFQFPPYNQMIKEFVQNYEFFVNPSADGKELITGIRAKNPDDPLAKHFEAIGNAVASLLNPLVTVTANSSHLAEKQVPNNEESAAEASHPDHGHTHGKACAGFRNSINIENIAKQLAVHHYQCRSADFGKDYATQFGKQLGREFGRDIGSEEERELGKEDGKDTENNDGEETDNAEGDDKGKDKMAVDSEKRDITEANPQQKSNENEKICHRVPQDASVAIALSQMLSMGFSNEGDWLLNLLESKHGDIIKVLEYLEHIKK